MWALMCFERSVQLALLLSGALLVALLAALNGFVSIWLARLGEWPRRSWRDRSGKLSSSVPSIHLFKGLSSG